MTPKNTDNDQETKPSEHEPRTDVNIPDLVPEKGNCSPLPNSDIQEENRTESTPKSKSNRDVIEDECSDIFRNIQTDDSVDETENLGGPVESIFEARKLIVDEPKTGRLFSFLQILTASFGAFAHGGNDVRYRKRLNPITKPVGNTIIQNPHRHEDALYTTKNKQLKRSFPTRSFSYRF